MNGKQARRLRKIVEKETGINPIGSQVRYLEDLTARKKNRKGQIFECYRSVLHPSCSKAKYRQLKKEWRAS